MEKLKGKGAKADLTKLAMGIPKKIDEYDDLNV